tara:strand:- start:1716 stop:2375 length:660 start_codon:yes stop_codon:yes gene_type:complete
MNGITDYEQYTTMLNDWYKMNKKHTPHETLAVIVEDKLEKLTKEYDAFKLARQEDKETKKRWRVAEFKKNNNYPKAIKIADIIEHLEFKIATYTRRNVYMNTKKRKSNHLPTADQLQQKAQEKVLDYPTSQLKCYRERIEKAHKLLEAFTIMTEDERTNFKINNKMLLYDTDEEVIDYYTGVINENKNNIKLFLIVMNKEKVKKIEENLIKKATGIFSC